LTEFVSKRLIHVKPQITPVFDAAETMEEGAMHDIPDRPRRPRDPEATRQNILDAAFIEFSDNGLSGTRVDAIAARTGTNVRMIYYYFGSKDGLYRAVLEQAYAAMRAAEANLGLESLAPDTAIQRMTEFVFDYHAAEPRFARLVTIENIHRAEHIARSVTMPAMNLTVISSIAAILASGQAEGRFRPDADPLGVHLLITGFCFFRVANRHTLRTIFGKDPLSPDLRDAHRRMAVESVLGYLRAGAPRRFSLPPVGSAD
jgi:TetR/AcrR family transcriptional regulator